MENLIFNHKNSASRYKLCDVTRMVYDVLHHHSASRTNHCYSRVTLVPCKQ
jgi:hypothetical protein